MSQPVPPAQGRSCFEGALMQARYVVTGIRWSHLILMACTRSHSHTLSRMHTCMHAPHFAACSHRVDACIWHQANDKLKLKAGLVSRVPACLGCVGIAYSSCPAFKHIQMEEVEVEQAAERSQACHISHELLNSHLHTQCITADLSLLSTANTASLFSSGHLYPVSLAGQVFLFLVLGIVKPWPIVFGEWRGHLLDMPC